MADTPLQRILYAEDETDIQEVASMALEAVGGYEMKICNNGQEAVEAAVAFNPDLIILDVMMPIMDGPTALEEIRKLEGFANIPAIFMTAKVQPQEVAEYIAMGAVEVIPKPFDPMNLPVTVQAIWERANR
ncbi:MAG: response regulator [Magnetococcales bacterium]|nr:response regulator [Magnetococcales bacterium]